MALDVGCVGKFAGDRNRGKRRVATGRQARGAIANADHAGRYLDETA